MPSMSPTLALIAAAAPSKKKFLGKRLKSMLTVVVVAILTACGGGGGGGSGSGGGTQQGTSGSVIFVADANSLSIGSSSNGNPAVGATTLDRLILGSSTGIVGAISGLAFDSSGNHLYVANGNSVLVFDNADTASGNLSPSHTIVTPAAGAGVGIFRGIGLDAANDRLYIPDSILGKVRIYTGASKVSGNPSFTTLASSEGLAAIDNVALDLTRDIAYVSYGASGLGPVIEAVDSAKSGGTTFRLLQLPSGSYFDAGVFADSSHDRLYVSDTAGSIYVFENAISGSIVPTRKITLPDSVRTKLAMDVANNRLYAVGSTALYIIDNAATAIGSVTAKKVTISGANAMEAVAYRQ